MATTRILRVPVLDSPQDYVLIRVDARGPDELDLQIAGTDEEAAFTGRVDHAKSAELRSKPIHIADHDWARALTVLFAPGKHDSTPHSAGELEVVARVENSCMTLIVRKNVQGITQRLGEITLREDDETEIRLFEWTSIAALATDSLQHKTLSLTTEVDQQQKRVAKLQTQLDELSALKTEHEDALLEKFALLLNSKKLKIRDQQRLLVHAKIDPRAAAGVVNARNSTRARSSEGSGLLKRKANADDLDDDDQVSESEPETVDGHLDEERRVETDDSERDGGQDSDLDDKLLAEHARQTQDSRPASDQPRTTHPAASQSSQPAAAVDEDDETTDDEL